MVMTKSLRVGVVGCGGIARAHASAYGAAAESEVVAVYDVRPQAAAALAREVGDSVAATRSIDELLGCGLQAVSVCTPPGVHLETCLPFIEAGIAVLCEKPLEKDLPTAKQLATAVDAADSLFMTAYCHRFHPPIMELRRLISAGVLGDPLLLRSIFSGAMDLSCDHRSRPSLSGGGSMIDNCSHSVDLFRHLMGSPRR